MVELTFNRRDKLFMVSCHCQVIFFLNELKAVLDSIWVDWWELSSFFKMDDERLNPFFINVWKRLHKFFLSTTENTKSHIFFYSCQLHKDSSLWSDWLHTVFKAFSPLVCGLGFQFSDHRSFSRWCQWFFSRVQHCNFFIVIFLCNAGPWGRRVIVTDQAIPDKQ